MESLYTVEHETQYTYASVVATSQHAAWLEPRLVPYQRHWSYSLAIDPVPLRRVVRTDYFGNVVHQFELLRPHQHLRVVSRGVVAVRDRALPVEPLASPPWEQVRRGLRHPSGSPALAAAPFTFESPKVGVSPEIDAFARMSFSPDRPLLDAAIALMTAIHDEFTFDNEATTPATPVAKVLEERRGVCQDFAHLQIASLRSLGLAARYVSGYILTDPPPGQPRLVGADASHAWVSVYCPAHGWVDLDPTNAVIVSRRHITIAWGRDFGDVAPLRGVLLGGSDHTVSVGVSVVPLDGVAEPLAQV